MSEPLCRDCQDLHRDVKATRIVRKTPVCEEHLRMRLGMPAIPKNEETTTMGRKPPDQATIDAMRADHEKGMNVQQISVKHGVGWGTARNYVSGSKKQGPARRTKTVNGADGVGDVLKHLREKRNALDRAIAALEEI